ncbi:MAG: transmembrane transcriptional regulator [Myxococcaceae bacterium]
MRSELSEAELERLFVGAADEQLADRDRVQLNAALDQSPELKIELEKYKNAIALLKDAPKEKAPPALAGMILRRARRRRFGLRNTVNLHNQYRVPVEVLIPILVGVLVAAFLFFAAH